MVAKWETATMPECPYCGKPTANTGERHESCLQRALHDTHLRERHANARGWPCYCVPDDPAPCTYWRR